MNPRPCRRSRGFTLVELMVGLTVGLFVVLASISVFVSTRALQTVSSAEARMGENTRLAMDLLQKDFRSAGFQGCKLRLQDPPRSLLAPNDGIFLDSGSSGLGGATGNGVFTPPLSATLLTVPSPPSVDSDVVSVRVPVEPMSLGLAAPMTTSVDAPNVGVATPGNAILQNDILLIANCKAAAIFQVTEASPQSTGVLSHAVGAGYPGNASADFQHVFRGDAAVYRLQTRHYYVAPSLQRPGTRALWRYVFPTTDGSAPAQEVVQGVERMRVTYGIDKDDDQTVTRYVDAAGMTSWDSVVAARIQLLMATVKDGVTLSPQTVWFNGATVLPADRRLRSVVTEVVTLRNRAP